MTRKLAAAALLLCICLSLVPTAWAYPAAKTLPALTGDQAVDIANIAASQLGYSEYDGTVYGAWWETQITWDYDYTHADWCGMFVAWCADKAGIGMGKGFDNTAALANGLYNFTKSHGHWDNSFLTDPKVGDYIFFADDPDGLADHVAIVVGYNEATRVITFVGGNQGGGRVTQSTCKWAADGMYGSQMVIGYGRPNYRTVNVSFMDRCTRYPAYRTLRISRQTTIYTQPCLPTENAKSVALTALAPGVKVTAVGLYQNPAGGCWYQIQYNGTTAYLYAKDATSEAALYSDLTVTDLHYPLTVKRGSAFYIGGILRSQYNVIHSVTAQIKRPGVAIFTGSQVVDNRICSLMYGPVDDALHFTQLANGDYLYSLSADVHNYYSTDGLTPKYDVFTRQFHTNAFRVSDSGKEKPSTYTVTFDPNGGVCELASKTYEYGSAYGLLPTPTNEGLAFDGWFTAKTGGNRITSAHLVSASQTLYAHWVCDHQWNQTGKTEPDCEAEGITSFSCTACGQGKEERQPALGHKWTVTETTKLTCVVDEAVYSTCDRCGKEQTEVLEQAPGHAWKEQSRTQQTCDTDERVYERCQVCKAEQDRLVKEAKGHQFQEGVCVTCGREAATLFADVTQDRYYFDSVLWAVSRGITRGVDTDHFGPDRSCTRAQVVTFLWRAKGSPAPQSEAHPFTDVDENGFYYKAMLWAVEQGITAGMSDTTFVPDGTCTRAQVVTFLYRAEGKPEVTGKTHAFTDVDEAAFYYTPMLWAVEQSITSGMSDTTFVPNGTCTRAQVVTFLHRADN